MSKEIIIGATPEQVNKNTSGRLYTVSQNATGVIDCNMYCFIKDIEQKDKKMADLEAKLAESEDKIKKAYQEGLLQKQFDKDMEIEQLKHQLAEKEELKLRIKKLDKLYSEALETVDSLFTNQDKISFAIEQLEKAKEILLENLYDLYSKPSEIWDEYGDLYDVAVEDAVNGTIDNQIKKLKEG